MLAPTDTISWGTRTPGASLASSTSNQGRGRPFLVDGRWLRRRLMQEGGFTLIELLVASALAIVVFGAVLAMVESSQQVQARDTEWALTVQEGRTGLARMAREIRQSSEIKTHEAGTIEFLATIGGNEWKIKYECGIEQSGTEYHECVRKAVEKSTGTLPGSGTPVVRGILKTQTTVFEYFKGSTSTTEPKEMNVVTLKVELPRKGTLKQAGSSGYTHSAVLENAALMRNCNIEASKQVNGC